MDIINKLWGIVTGILEYTLLENPLKYILASLLTFGMGLLLKNFFSDKISRVIYLLMKNKKVEVPVDKLARLLQAPLQSFFVFVLVYLSTRYLHFPEAWNLVEPPAFGLKLTVSRVYGIAFFLLIFWVLVRVIDFLGLILIEHAKDQNNILEEQLVPFIKQLLKIGTAIITIFSIMGFVMHLDVGSIITGLGIGGVAVALAGKETLENLLASFTIFIDKPFVAGDVIKTGGIMGNVEQIGFRSTLIRTLDKTLVSIPNKQLIDQPMENYSLRSMFRVSFELGVPYGLTSTELESLKQKVMILLQQTPKVSKDTILVYLSTFGSYTFLLHVIYFVEEKEYEHYASVRDAVNMSIVKLYEQNNLNFEYPTQVIQTKSI